MLQQKWSTKLLDYDYEIRYRRGLENRVADGLSRLHEKEGQLNVITIIKPQWYQDILDSYANDVVVTDLIQHLQADPNCKPHYTLVNGVLRYKHKLYISQNESAIIKDSRSHSFISRGRALRVLRYLPEGKNPFLLAGYEICN